MVNYYGFAMKNSLVFRDGDNLKKLIQEFSPGRKVMEYFPVIM